MVDEVGTAQAAVKNFPTMSSPTASDLVREVGWLRSRKDLFSGDVDDLHHEVQNYDLDQRAAVKARSGVPTLLVELADRGMAWADIARMVGVSVAAVRKWRSNGGAAPESRMQLARLTAFLDLLEESAIEDPAQWMELTLPLPSGYPVTANDLYARGAYTPLLDYAAQRRTATEVMDEVDDQWRIKRSDFEVFTDSDGARSIRPRTDG